MISRNRFLTVLSLSVALLSKPAFADESAYCQKVRARASSDAALLFSPTVQAQGIKFPDRGTIDSGVTTGAGYQARAVVTMSPLDVYRGFRVDRVADADCRHHEAAQGASELVAQGTEHGRLPALDKQVEFLDAHRSEWELIQAKAEERVAAHVASLRDVAEIRSRVHALVRTREQRKGEADGLRTRGTFRGSLSSLVRESEQTSMQLEREVSHLRSLDAWELRVTGGVIPQAQPIDWFGVVAVGVNLGTFSRNAAESRYLDARERELRTARYELRAQVAELRERITNALRQAQRELETLEQRATLLAADRATLEHADAPNAAQALALIALDSIGVEAERVFLSRWVAELERISGSSVSSTR